MSESDLKDERCPTCGLMLLVTGKCSQPECRKSDLMECEGFKGGVSCAVACCCGGVTPGELARLKCPDNGTTYLDAVTRGDYSAALLAQCEGCPACVPESGLSRTRYECPRCDAIWGEDEGAPACRDSDCQPGVLVTESEFAENSRFAKQETAPDDHLRTHDGWDLVAELREERDRLISTNDTLVARIEDLNQGYGLEDTCPRVQCRATSRRLKAQCEQMRHIIEAAKDVSLDHSCGLEGWDEACAECRLAKLMYAEGVSPQNVYPVHEVGPETVDEHLRTHDGWDIVEELRAALKAIKDYADECVANADRVSVCTLTISNMARKALR